MHILPTEIGKRQDILVYSDGTYVKVEVTSKTIDKWTWIKGIPDEGVHLLIFVDFTKKELCEKPNFYIMTALEWRNMLPNLDGIKNNPKYAGVDPKDNHTPIWKDSRNKGIGIKVIDVEQQLDKWEKLENLLNKRDESVK